MAHIHQFVFLHYTPTDLAHVLEFHLVDVPEYGIFNHYLLNPYTHPFYLLSRLLHEQHQIPTDHQKEG
jgi:hypothetical protein